VSSGTAVTSIQLSSPKRTVLRDRYGGTGRSNWRRSRRFVSLLGWPLPPALEEVLYGWDEGRVSASAVLDLVVVGRELEGRTA
jgi:hypothetical protein